MTHSAIPRAFFLLCAVHASLALATEGHWPFVPSNDAGAAAPILDLRSINEKQSGETGFVQLSADGNSFIRGDGKPIRFWACGSDLYRNTPDEMDRHCRFLARLGVNMARLHVTVTATKEGSRITDVDETVVAGVFRFIKAAKDNGIYVTISPYYGHHKTPASWGLDGYGPDREPWGAIFIDPKMQDAYRAWTRELYTRKNPHTGLAIKDDPTVAILQVHNEDSMFFWTMQRLPQAQSDRLAKLFAAWLTKKHGSLDNAVKAWDGHKEKGDDVGGGAVALMSTWHMTQEWKGGQAKRMRDQVQFLAEHQRAFYASMGKYLRQELGCKQLLNASNWRTADDLKLKEIERWTYAALDIDAENEYYGSDYQHLGANNGYRIDPGHHFIDESCLHKPLEQTTNFKSQVGHPFIVTETSWKHPNLYQAEGPFLASAYQSLGGVDAVYWFSAGSVDWLHDPRRLFWMVGDSHAIDKWSCSTPMLMGMFPAAALTYRMGYVKEGEPVVREERSLAELWDRKPPVIDDNEIYGVSRETQECKSPRTKDGRVSRAAFLVGPVQLKLDGDPAKTTIADFAPRLDGERGGIASNTGQLNWDYVKGVCTMDAPCAQGVAGFLAAAGSRFQLGSVDIESSNAYAAVSVVALDDKPLGESRRVLVQVGTTARLSGWQEKDAEFPFDKTTIKGKQIMNTGQPPWQIADTQVTVTIRNEHLTKASRLDINGRRAEDIAVTAGAKLLTFKLPRNTMYAIVE